MRFVVSIKLSLDVLLDVLKVNARDGELVFHPLGQLPIRVQHAIEIFRVPMDVRQLLVCNSTLRFQLGVGVRELFPGHATWRVSVHLTPLCLQWADL